MARDLGFLGMTSGLDYVGALVHAESESSPTTNYAWVWWLVVAVLLLVAAGIAFLIRRRRMQEPVDITDDIDRAAHRARVRDVKDELAGPPDRPAHRADPPAGTENRLDEPGDKQDNQEPHS